MSDESAMYAVLGEIRKLKPTLYVSSDGKIPEDYKNGFADGFYDALEQVDVLMAKQARGIKGGDE